MIPEAELLLDSLDARTKFAIRKATFVGIDTGMALVDMGDSRFACDFGNGYVPVVGETVRIWSIGDQHFLFPTGARPTVGTVLTVSATAASVSTSNGTISCWYAGTAPTSGDRVGIVWSEDGPWCTSRLSSSPPPPQPPPPDPGTVEPTVRSAEFRAIDAGSTDRSRVRWWTGQPRAGNSTYGAWFYGGQIKDTIPAGAQFVSMEFYAAWWQRSGAAPNFGLHADPFKAGVPNVVGTAAWSPSEGWNPMPYGADWFPNLIAGGPHYGIGLDQGGDNIFANLAQNAMSGAIRITWRS
jgi:hypothetical protein